VFFSLYTSAVHTYIFKALGKIYIHLSKPVSSKKCKLIAVISEWTVGLLVGVFFVRYAYKCGWGY